MNMQLDKHNYFCIGFLFAIVAIYLVRITLLLWSSLIYFFNNLLLEHLQHPSSAVYFFYLSNLIVIWFEKLYLYGLLYV